MKIGLSYDLKSTVAILPGGPEDEAEEYDPPSTIDAIASEIEGLGHQVIHLGGGTTFLEKIRSTQLDFVFNIAEGRGIYRSREAQVPSVLEMLGIPYCGSDPLTLSICLDKPIAKRIAISAGVNTPAFQVIESLDDLNGLRDSPLPLPAVVKPAFEGSSKGIRLTSKVNSWNELERAVEVVLRMYKQPALVEEFIPGKEITVGLVGSRNARIVGVMEVIPKSGPNDNFMYTLEVKKSWENLVQYRCPPDLPSSCICALENAASTLFKVFQCRDMARMDFRVDKNYRPYFLETNPLPGLSPVYSDLPIMAKLSGWTYKQLIEAILNSALGRYGIKSAEYAYRNSL